MFILAPCVHSKSTLELNEEFKEFASHADITLEKYYAKAIQVLEEYGQSTAFLKESQDAWLIFRKKDCSAYYEHWKEGTIRTIKYYENYIRLTKSRCIHLWENYLTYEDSTPPILPKPFKK